jgi:uncharacterized protein
MTRILVISDTHLSQGSGRDGSRFNLLERLQEQISQAVMILHAGDHTGAIFYQILNREGTLVSVCGNMDDEALQNELPERTTVEVEGVTIGLVHGWGEPKGLAKRVYQAWSEEKPDMIVFGHSHLIHHSRIGTTILFNPGSPTLSYGHQPTVGVIEIDAGNIRPFHLHIPFEGRYPRLGV